MPFRDAWNDRVRIAGMHKKTASHGELFLRARRSCVCQKSGARATLVPIRDDRRMIFIAIMGFLLLREALNQMEEML